MVGGAYETRCNSSSLIDLFTFLGVADILGISSCSS